MVGLEVKIETEIETEAVYAKTTIGIVVNFVIELGQSLAVVFVLGLLAAVSLFERVVVLVALLVEPLVELPDVLAFALFVE